MSIAEIRMSCTGGNPTNIRKSIAMPEIIRTRGCEKNVLLKSALSSSSADERVTIIPVDTEIRRAGTCDIRPSPTVATE